MPLQWSRTGAFIALLSRVIPAHPTPAFNTRAYARGEYTRACARGLGHMTRIFHNKKKNHPNQKSSTPPGNGLWYPSDYGMGTGVGRDRARRGFSSRVGAGTDEGLKTALLFSGLDHLEEEFASRGVLRLLDLQQASETQEKWGTLVKKLDLQEKEVSAISICLQDRKKQQHTATPHTTHHTPHTTHHTPHTTHHIPHTTHHTPHTTHHTYQTLHRPNEKIARLCFEYKSHTRSLLS